MQIKLYIALVIFLGKLSFIQAQYISEVLEYQPAPGQLINIAPWGLPESAQSIIGGINGSLSLGSFGGYVVFRFEDPVQNHPDHPFGVDFTIFGNPGPDWSEPGIVWVMKDENGNGLPDDTWYQLAGSDYFFSSTQHNYQVTYFNPDTNTATDVPWEDNVGFAGFVFANSIHTQPYYPLPEFFSSTGNETFSLEGTLIRGRVEKDNPPFNKSYRRTFGYADNHFRGSPNSTLPANPYTRDTENGGGDGFDISWAVDENGNYVELDEIHFVKVQTAMLADAGWLGEVSTEITGARISQPDNSINGVEDLIVIKDLPNEITTPEYQLEVFVFNQGRIQWDEKILWSVSLEGAVVNEDHLLQLMQSGQITITAWLENKPEITAAATTIVKLTGTNTSKFESGTDGIRLFPNPAKHYFQIDGMDNAEISIFTPAGRKVLEIFGYVSGQSIDISGFPVGVYLVQIKKNGSLTRLKLIKN